MNYSSNPPDSPQPYRTWVEAGFGAELVPVCGPSCDCANPGKRPHESGWESRSFEPWYFTDNIGLRTRYFPVIDVDVEEADLAGEIACLAGNILGWAPLRSRANSGRCALLYRLSDQEKEPFKKRILKLGASGKVEILGDGQQTVVAGIHKSGAILSWSDPPIACDLSEITETQILEFLVCLKVKCRELGCKVDPDPPPPVAKPLLRVARPSPEDEARAADALDRIDPDLPYDDWLKVGMALHDRWPGENDFGFFAWNEWSARGEKYQGERDLARHWKSFKVGAVHFGSLFHLAMGGGVQ